MRKVRASSLACLALLIGLVLPATTAHAQYPPCTASGQVSRTNVSPGATVVFSGSGFTPGALLTIAFDGTTIDTTTADGSGAFSVTVTVPGDAAPGTHTLTATGDRPDEQPCPNGEDPSVLGAQIVRATIVVGGGLAGTGSNSTVPMVAVGVTLVLAGAGAVVVARKRRHRLAVA